MLKDKVSNNFINIFNNHDDFTIDKTSKIFEYYLKLIYENSNNNIDDLDNNSIKIINNYYKRYFINKNYKNEELERNYIMLEKKVKVLENNLQEEKNEKIEFKKKISEKDNDIKEAKKTINKSNEKIKNLEKIIQNNFNIENENMISVIFNTLDDEIQYSLFCKANEKFIIIESIFYEKYPEFIENENHFYVNGKKINKYKNLEENGIKNGDIIFIKTQINI